MNPIPLIGREIGSTLKGWRSLELPLHKMARANGTIPKVVGKLLEGKKLPNSEIRIIWEGMSIAVGAPYIGARRAITAVEEEDIMELIGVEARK